MKNSRRENALQLCLQLALLLLGFVAAMQFLGVGGFYLNHSLSRAQPICALAATLALALFRPAPIHLRLLASAAFAAVLALALGLATAFADVTCDGQAYHGTAIMQLLHGWNPISEPDRAENNFREAIVNFPKGAWICAAQLCLLARNVEAGKALNLILLAAVGSLALYASLRYTRLSPLRASLLAAAGALNPISANQLVCYYVDGQVASLFALTGLCSTLVFYQRRFVYVALTALTIAVFINVKLTALLYVAAIAGATMMLALWQRHWQALRRLTAVYGAGLVLGAALGFNPYVTNYLTWSNPFHPYGPGGFQAKYEAGFVDRQMPASFRGRNRLDALWRSIFGRCNNEFDLASRSFSGGPLKIPFTVGRDELKTFEGVDTRICGWGPLTSGILLLAASGVFLAYRGGQKTALPISWTLAAAGAVVFTMLAAPYAWNARYAPQLPLLGVLALLALWLSRGQAARLCGWLLFVLMMANVIAVTLPCLRSTWTKTQALRAQLRFLATQPEPCAVVFGEYGFNRLRFEEAGIRYRSVDILPPGSTEMILAGEVLHTCYTAVALPP